MVSVPPSFPSQDHRVPILTDVDVGENDSTPTAAAAPAHIDNEMAGGERGIALSPFNHPGGNDVSRGVDIDEGCSNNCYNEDAGDDGQPTPAGCPLEERRSLPQLAGAWVRDGQALVLSSEMSTFAHTSGDLALALVGMAFHITFLPITVPTRAVVCASTSTFHTVTSISSSVFNIGHDGGQVMTTRETPEERHWGIAEVACNAVPLFVRGIEKVRDEVGGVILGLLGLGDGDDKGDEDSGGRTESGQSSAEPVSESGHHRRHQQQRDNSRRVQRRGLDPSLADRLRLDYSGEGKVGPSDDESDNEAGQALTSDPSDVVKAPVNVPLRQKQREPIQRKSSSFLRVCDLGLYAQSNSAPSDDAADASAQAEDDKKAVSLTYLELHHYNHESHVHNQLDITVRALDALTKRGRELAHNDDFFGQPKQGPRPVEIPEWKAENNTKKLLDRTNLQNQQQWLDLLEKETLIWSGKMDNNGKYGHGIPLFKARGVVNLSPHDFAQLLLDSERAGEYNRFSLGRTDEVVLQQGISRTDGQFGAGETKIVRSETRVPFAGRSVVLWTLMHAREILEEHGNNREVAYIIVSRSVSSVCSKKGASGQNEIIWGVNLFRSVPGHPSKTELTSVSQVSSTLVPAFLAHRIGIMGVVDFFSTVRRVIK